MIYNDIHILALSQNKHKLLDTFIPNFKLSFVFWYLIAVGQLWCCEAWPPGRGERENFPNFHPSDVVPDGFNINPAHRRGETDTLTYFQSTVMKIAHCLKEASVFSKLGDLEHSVTKTPQLLLHISLNVDFIHGRKCLTKIFTLHGRKHQKWLVIVTPICPSW